MIRRVLPLLLLALSVSSLRAQLSVQPAWLYLDAERPAATLELRNGAPAAASYAVTLRGKNGDGTVASCREWLRTDTKVLRVPPNGSASLSVAAEVPAGVADGEYAADLIFTRDADAGADAAREETIVPVHVRVGEVYSDVKLAGAGAERRERDVIFRFHLAQLGNAAYHGNLVLRLEDGKGREVHARKGTVDVYGKGTEELVLSSASVPPGRYRVFMHFDSDRTDLGARAIPVLPKKYTIDIRMP